MTGPTLTEAAKTDLPRPKPNRRRRIAARVAILVVAVSALGAAYWFTRPPELVWWTSPKIGDSGLRLKVIFPSGWVLTPSPNNPSAASQAPGRHPEWAYWFQMSPVDGTPSYLRWIFPYKPEQADLTIIFGQPKDNPFDWSLYGNGIQKFDMPPHRICIKYALRRKAGVWAFAEYRRTNLPAFNRTYRQICDSLQIVESP